MKNRKPYAIDTAILPSVIGSGQRCILIKSWSFPTRREGTIGELMDVFLHQQQSTIKHICEDIKKIKRPSINNKKYTASYKIGVYREDVFDIKWLEWFDQEIFAYFNSLEWYTAKIDNNRPISAWATHSVRIEISWTDIDQN